jgi:predicted transcriptional regulator
MTITRNRTSNTVVSKSIEALKYNWGYSIAEIADVLGVSQQLVSNALQGNKVGAVNENAAQYYLAWQEADKMRAVAEKKVQTQDNIIAQLNARPADTETVTRLETANREQADTIAVLKAALRSLI